MASQQAIEGLADRLDALVDDGMLAGWAAAVVDGEGTATGHGGARTLGGAAMTDDTLFLQTSCSKPYAGALTLRMAELGVLELDDPIERWLPELAEPRVLTSPSAPLDDTVAVERPITVLDLLTMTPGFGWVAEQGPLADAIERLEIGPGPWPLPMAHDELLARLGSLPLADQPGASWRYHQSSVVLGALLARASRTPLDALLAEHVLAPLDLRDTAFVGDASRMPTVYEGDERTPLRPMAMPAGVGTTPPMQRSLANGLVSTMTDHARFLASLVGTGPQVLDEGSRTALGTDRLTAAQQATAAGFLDEGCGWGLHVEVRPEGWIGWAGGLGTIGYADPSTGRAAALGTQTSFGAPGTAPAFDAFWSLLV